MFFLAVLFGALAAFSGLASADSASDLGLIAQATALYPDCAVSVRMLCRIDSRPIGCAMMVRIERG